MSVVAILVLLALNMGGRAVSAASVNPNIPQSPCKVVLLENDYSFKPGEVKTVAQNLDISRYNVFVYDVWSNGLLHDSMRSEVVFGSPYKGGILYSRIPVQVPSAAWWYVQQSHERIPRYLFPSSLHYT